MTIAITCATVVLAGAWKFFGWVWEQIRVK